MECDICSSLADKLNCTACARECIYLVRIQQVQTLLEKERLGKQVKAIICSVDVNDDQAHKIPEEAKITVYEGSNKHTYEQTLAETAQVRCRFEHICRENERLRSQIATHKQELVDRRKFIVQRRSELQKAKSTSLTEKTRALESAVRRVSRRFEGLHRQIVSDRTFLCREAAALAGLCKRQQRIPEGSGFRVEEAFEIGGVTVIDLRDLNSTPPQQISASLTQIARLLVLVCQYLHIRLPAEITLPHTPQNHKESWPLPTILPPASSYLGRDLVFPRSTPSSSPSASRALDPRRRGDRPRPLYLDRKQKLTTLAAEDPNRYHYFVEGVSLLAWDVTWLCRTQGLDVAANDWEEVCQMGKNLWTLLVGNHQARLPDISDPSGEGRSSALPHVEGNKPHGVSTAAATQLPKQPSPPPGFAVLSHGSAHSFLHSDAAISVAHGVEVSAQRWPFASPKKIVVNLRSRLANEMGADWDLLDSGEYEGLWADGLADSKAVLMGPNAGRGVQDGPVAIKAEFTSLVDTKDDNTSRARGTSGWMKLRSRAND